MNRNMFRIWPVAVALLCILSTGSVLRASPSGLNNIPTTDVVPVKTLVLQTWFDWADDAHPKQTAAFKAGLVKGLEFGVDWKFNDVAHSHAALQAKYAFDIAEDVWRGVVGIANVSDNRQHNGDIFPYVATSVDLKLARLHFGYAPEPHNEAFFAGIDRTFPFLERNLQLKADAIHVDDKDDVLFSAGFLYELGRQRAEGEAARGGLLGVLDKMLENIILEAWVSMPSTGANEIYTVKLNYVIKF